MSKRGKDILAIVLLCAVVVTIYADVIVLGMNFFVRDHYRYHYPTKHIVREVILDGEFPHWNRYYAGGQPLAANPEFELFYPPHWIILLPDYELGYGLLVLVHVLIAGIGMYVLGRTLGARPEASFITAVSLMLCGPFVSEMSRLGTFLAISWWPWIAAGAVCYFSTGSRRALAGSVVAFGLQALVGEPHAILMSSFLVCGIALGEAVRERTANALGRNIARAAAIGVLGVLFGAAQIVPSLDLLRDSVRAEGFSFQQVSMWSFPPERLPELVLPGFLGRFWVEGREIYWGGWLYPEKTFPFIFSIYLGLLAPVLFVAAAIRGIPRFRAAAVFCIALVPLLLGRNAPLLGWLYEAGILTNLRYTERLAALIGFVVLALSALALEHLLAGDRKLRRNVLVLLAVAMLVAAAAAAVAAPERFASYFRLPDTPFALLAAGAFRSDALMAAFKCLALAAILVYTGRNVRLGVLLICVFVIADLAPLNKRLAPRVAREFFTEPPNATTLRNELAGARLFPQASYQPAPPLPEQFLVGLGRLSSTRSAVFPMTPSRWGIEMALDPDIGLTWLRPTKELLVAGWELRDAGRSDWAAVLMAFSDARFRTLWRDPASIPADADPARVAPIAFVEGRPTERFYFADRLVRARSRSEVVTKLLTIEAPWRHAFLDLEPFPPAPGRVLSSRQGHNHLELEVESEGRGFLVLSITAHKYWTATLDGSTVPLYRTNLAYQGLEVPAGRHRVTMRYRNTLVLPAVIVSLITAAAMLLLSLVPSVDRRGRGDAPNPGEDDATPL
ncbi:MAG: YfhO family protein [Thermoanaerobaculia bacterium]